MTTLAATLKDEINRLSRKVFKEHASPLQKQSAAHRRQLAAMKKTIAALRRDTSKLQKDAPPTRRPTGDEGSTEKLRFQAKGLRSLRARLSLSARDFGLLVGVSGQTIYNWEGEKATPRRAQIAALASVRKLGKRDVLQRLSGGKE